MQALQALYNKSLRVRSAVPHPKIMGIIRECGGKMHMSEGLRPLACLSKYLLTSGNQRTGRMLRVTSSSRSATTMRLALSKEFKSSNIWFLQAC
jgi:hypothetical protein